jgi:hypothetical protein
VVLEGAVLGKPAVMANFDGLPPRGTYVQRGLARAARTPAALTAIVDELTAAGRRPASDARTEEGLVDLLGPVDGRASERIAEFIRLLLAGGRPAASHACS